jgi:hypothetical protein
MVFGSDMKGSAPQGIWWVAWRQHRLQVAALLAIMAAAAAALVIFRSRIVAVYSEFGCELFPDFQGFPYGGDCVDADGFQVWWSYGFSELSRFAHLGMIGGPIVLGAFAAAPVFTREFGHGTHVLALTQSVGRGRWLVAKTTVVVLPLVAGLLVLGSLMEWTDKTIRATAYAALNPSNFFARGLIPAGIGLVAFGLTLALGMITRKALASLVAGALVAGAILFGLAIAQPYLVPADRTSLPVTSMFPPMTQADIDLETSGGAMQNTIDVDPDEVAVRSGYLDVDGKPMDVSGPAVSACYEDGRNAGEAAAVAAGLMVEVPSVGSGTRGVAAAIDGDAFNTPEYRTAANAATLHCMTSMGIAATYHDSLPGSMLWPLRWVVTGICAILAALFLGVSAWRLKSAVAKR